MITVINQDRKAEQTPGHGANGRLWLPESEVERITGWSVGEEGLRDGEGAVSIPAGKRADFLRDGEVNVAAFWRLMERPVLSSASGEVWMLGNGAAEVGAALQSLEAPDFTLPDLEGKLHSLSDFRGKKVFLASWASWWGARYNLPVWEELYQELKQHGLMVLAVAFDSREGASRPWIEEANPSYVTLIDRYHQVAELYNMVNVNQAVWIDEAGRIVRPTESAGAYEGFRKVDRKTSKMPDDVAKITNDVKTIYHDALRDWTVKGAGSEYAFDAEQARAHLMLPTAEVAEAHAAFSLGQYLIGIGQAEEGNRLVREASRLHPDSWNFWRQGAELDERGLAAKADFWQRVDALGDKRYYAAVDMKGMPG